MKSLYRRSNLENCYPKIGLFLILIFITQSLLARNISDTISRPGLYSFSPVVATTSDTVIIHGDFLAETYAVDFGGVPASSFAVTGDTLIKAVVGNGASGYVTIATPYGLVTRLGFTFYTIPSISSFNPSSATTGTTVTIHGVNFYGAVAVSFGGTAAASFSVISDSVITAVVGSGTSGPITVTNAMASGNLAGFTFTPPVVYPPSIQSLSPATGNQGTQVTIRGSHFTGTTAVYFGGVNANSFNIISDSLIEAVVGWGAAGLVKVVTPDGIDSSAGFLFVPLPPEINSFSPTSAKYGLLVIINGIHLAAVNSVFFGSEPALSWRLVSDNIIYAVVGAGATGMVSLISGTDTARLDGFTFLQTPMPPMIDSFSPLSGIAGTTVTIMGYNFATTSSVYFGDQPAASFEVISNSEVRAVVGTGSSGTISLTTDGGFSQIRDFTFLDSLQEQVIIPAKPFNLPILAGGVHGDKVLLNWQMDYDRRITAFIIERWTDSSQLSGIGILASSTDSGIHSYSYLDTVPGPDTYYYRLRMISDTAGLYSNTVRVDFLHSEENIKIYPNPATGYVDIEYPLSTNAGSVKLMDFMGKNVLSVVTQPNTGKIRLVFSGRLKGIYKMVWTDGANTYSKNLMIQ